MCIAYWSKGYLPDEVLQGDFTYAKKHIDDDTRRAYFFLTTRLANHLISQPRDYWLTKLLAPFVCGWAFEMYYRANNLSRQNKIGSTMCAFGVPVFRIIGKTLYRLGYKKIIPSSAEYALSLVKQKQDQIEASGQII